MSALATTTFEQPVQPNSQLLDQVNAIRAQMGLPPLDSGAGLDFSARQAPLPPPVTSVQPAGVGSQSPLVTPPPANLPPPVAPQQPAQAPQAAQPAQAAQQPPDRFTQTVRNIAQFFNPGLEPDKFDLRKIPAVTTTGGGVTDEFLTDLGRPGDPHGGGFGGEQGRGFKGGFMSGLGGGEGIGINRPNEIGGTPTGRPGQKFFTVRVGNLEVGKFLEKDDADTVRDRLRSVFRQGPSPSIPRVGGTPAGARVSLTGSSFLDRELLRANIQRGKTGGGLDDLRRDGERTAARLVRAPTNPEEHRIGNLVQQLVGGANTGPTLTGAGAGAALDRAVASGLIKEELSWLLNDFLDTR